jgi:hypothetical protein
MHSFLIRLTSDARKYGVTPPTREQINKIYNDGHTKPKMIIEKLQQIKEAGVNDNIIIPKLKCLYNYLATFKKTLYGIANMKLGSGISGEIKQDIQFLQLSQNRFIFDKGAGLFLEKYYQIDTEDSDYIYLASEAIIDFLQYFDHEWITLHPNWFEGFCSPNNVAAPSTNNGTEGTNSVIKDETTLREQLSLGQFHTASFKMMTKWSKWCDPTDVNAKLFAKIPFISTPTWTLAFQWKLGKPEVLKPFSNKYFIRSSKSDLDLNDAVFYKYQDLMSIGNFGNFSQFCSTAFGYYLVTLPSDTNNGNWINGTCTCPTYFKKYICKHVLGIALYLNDDVCDIKKIIPEEACNKDLDVPRGRGRPSLIPKALEFVPHKFANILCEEEEEEEEEERNDTDMCAPDSNLTQTSASSQQNVDSIVETERMLINPDESSATNSGEATSIFTQIASTQREAIKYNNNGTIAKKRGPKVTNRSQAQLLSTQIISQATTQLDELQSTAPIRYNKNGSVAKKRGPKPKTNPL